MNNGPSGLSWVYRVSSRTHHVPNLGVGRGTGVPGVGVADVGVFVGGTAVAVAVGIDGVSVMVAVPVAVDEIVGVGAEDV